MENQILTFIPAKEDETQRIDKYLAEKNKEMSRSYIQKLIEDGFVTKAGKALKSNYKISMGDEIHMEIPALVQLDIQPEAIPLDIIYEDEDVILINKPKNMVVHPAPGHYSGTIVNALLYHCKNNLSGINGIMRPGIVHRIDMDTTGVIVVCKNDKSHNCLANQLKEHSITRKYNAIVYGRFPEESGVIEAPIGRHPVERKKMAINYKNGKPAITHYNVLRPLEQNYSYIECTLETGRTHQIRVHMASIKHPLLGDKVYGPKKPKISYLDGQTLHARVLGFIHPTTKKYMEFEAPLPDYFNELLVKLNVKE